MTPQKESHLNRIRINSAYPAFRGVVNFCIRLLYAIAALLAIFALLSFARGWFITVAGLLLAAVVALLGRAWGEVALMLADITDSTLEYHASISHKT
jgi:hypothetical protein